MAFQQQAYLRPPKGALGAKASLNPIQSVKCGQGNFTAGPLGLVLAKFAWQNYNVATQGSVLNNASPLLPTVPLGFIANEMQALNTMFMQAAGMTIPAGMGASIFDRGDFWGASPYGEVVMGQPVFVNLFSGDILSAPAGATPFDCFGSASAFTASIAAGSCQMVVSAVASGFLEIGQQVYGPNIPSGVNAYIDQFESGSGTLGGPGTYILTFAPAVASTGASYTSTLPFGQGGATGTATFAGSVMTVTAGGSAVPGDGQFVPGQLLYPASATYPNGLYIESQLTVTSGLPGGLGTYQLSAAPSGTLTSQTVNASAFIQTSWTFTSAGNVGDLVSFGLH